MNNPYQQFKDTKRAIDENKKAARAVLTLEWYEKIEAMRENPCYSDSERFLRSVSEFIEEHETITDRQIEVVERIYRHPNWD